MIEFLHGIDIYLMYFFNGTIRNPVFNWLMPLFDNDRAWVLPLAAVWLLVMIFGDRRARWFAVGALVLVGITDPLSSRVVKPLIARIRPCNILGGLNMWKNGAWIVLPDPIVEFYRGSWSFTSSHAVNTGAQAFWWGWAYPHTRYIWWGFAGIIGLSRVYIGVHWPSDILGGWLLGGVCFLVLWVVAVKALPRIRGRVEGRLKSEKQIPEKIEGK